MQTDLELNSKFVQITPIIMYYRDLQSQLELLSQSFPVISVTGPRQSGKTTLCKMVFPHYAYLNLEQSDIREAMQRDMYAELRKYKEGVIIDEAHYLPEVFSAIKVLVDEDKSRRYVLTGSSNFLLLQNISQTLAGRVAVLKLLPFSLNELGSAQRAFSTDSLLLRGFFPAIWGDGRPLEAVYSGYFSTYVLRDVRMITNVKDIDLFSKFVRLCATRVGTEFNANSLSAEVGVSVKTVQSWLSILQASYIVFTLQPYYRNMGKRLVKSPKIYFYDTGLLCYLLGLRSELDVANCPLRGALFENLVVADRVKELYHAGLENNYYFYRDKSQHEVDLVQEQAMQIRAYEIKSATTVHSSFFANLDYLRKVYGADVLSTQVIYDGTQRLEDPRHGYVPYR